MATTREDIIERGMPLVKTLQDAGIQASCYARGPAGNDIFMVGKMPGIPGMIMLWPGAEHVEVTAITDKELNQAVLVVKEPKRTITQTVTANLGFFTSVALAKQAARNIDNGQLQRRFTIEMPRGTTYKVTERKVWTDEVPRRGQPGSSLYYKLTAKVTASTEATEQSLLVGKDEVSQFVAMLPSTPKSVKGAHRILRPAGISAKAVRQGEWFFTPATAEEIKLLAAIPSQNSGFRRRRDRKSGYMRLENGSSHMAQEMQLILANTGREYAEFVKGVIRDTRTGHHHDLMLETWHKVVRNTEVTQQSTTSPTRSNQPRRSWD